jgi:hypothetical protein
VVLDVLREADDLVRVLADLDGRLARAGVPGLPGPLAAHDDAERALAVFSQQEIAWAIERVRHLLDMLVDLQSRLQGLRALKARGARLGEQRTP